MDENAHISVDPKVYAEKYEQLADRYAKAKDKLDKTETEIANRNSRKNMIAAFLDELEKQEHLITDFDTGLWNAVIESMTIYSKEHIFLSSKAEQKSSGRLYKQGPHRETKTVIFACTFNFCANGRKQSECIISIQKNQKTFSKPIDKTI